MKAHGDWGGNVLAKELAETGVTVRLAVVLLEGSSAQLAKAVGADKVLRVVAKPEGIDAAIARDWLLAGCTHHAGVATMVFLAVEVTVLSIELTS